MLKKNKTIKFIFLFIFGIFLINFISASSIYLFPNNIDLASTNVQYEFNFTEYQNCSGVILSHNEILTFNSRGVAFAQINFSSDIANYTKIHFLCEYRDSLLRKVHNLSSQFFDKVFINDLYVSNNVNVTGNLTARGLNITDISYFGNHLLPYPTLTNNLGSGANRWNYLYVTNISSDYIDNANDIVSIGNITGAYFYGSGAYLENLNLSGNFTGAINASDILNEYWVNIGGDTMTGTLVTPEISTSCVSGGNIEFGQCGVNVRLNLTSAGNLYGIGPWDTDDSISANSLIIRNSRTIPQLITTIDRAGITVYDNSAGDNIMINLTLAGNYIGIGNVTTDWFKGKFNWTEISKYLSFDGSTLDFNETELNDSIDVRTISIIYNASQIITVSGTLDAGDLDSILIPEDDDTYNVSEATGGGPLTITINFTSVTSFDSIVGRVHYDGGLGHVIQLEIQRSDTGAWENYLDLTDTTNFVNIYVPVFDPEQHIFGDGNVSIRFQHVQSGVPSHNFYIDYLTIVDGWTTLTVADHDALGGRDDIDNHPWALDKNGSRALTGDWNFGTYNINGSGNITANYFFGNGSQLDGVGGLPGGTEGAIQFYDGGSLGGNVNQFFINKTSGNVGIGTSSPNQKLDVDATSGSAASFSTTGSAYYSTYIINNHVGGNGLYIKAGTGATALKIDDTNDLELFRIDGDGNVGIGTATPNQKLHVVGNVNASGGRVYDETGFVQPVGAIIAYGGATAPTGWVLCDGSSKVTTGTYADLFAAIGYTYGGSAGNFNVPDLRGIFPRGAGTNTRVTGSTTLGTYQENELKSHNHLLERASRASGSYQDAVTTSGQSNHGYTGSTGGTETRPANVGVTYIIKY